MNLRLLIVLVVVAAILIALAGWVAQGIRWLAGGWLARRPRLVTA